MNIEICTISHLFSLCGGAIKVVGESQHKFKIGTSVRISKSTDDFFYASVTEVSFSDNIIEITLENFGENELKKGMKIYLT